MPRLEGQVPRTIRIGHNEIRSRVVSLGAEISLRLPRGPVHVVVVLTGGLVFGADLARALTADVVLDTLRLKSYGGNFAPQSDPIITSGLAVPVAGQPVLLVDDIIDTGSTLAAARKYLIEAGASQLWTAVLLRKNDRRTASIDPDFVGFDLGPEYVCGYGLDDGNLFRNLPDIMLVEGPAASGQESG